MMFLDLAIYFNSLPTETKIMTISVICLIFETIVFFELRKFFNEEEKRLKQQYQSKS